MYDQFARPVGAAMPAITEILKSKRKTKTATETEYKEQSWKMPHAEWLIVLDSKSGDERKLKEMTRTQIAELITSKHETAWRPPVSPNAQYLVPIIENYVQCSEIFQFFYHALTIFGCNHHIRYQLTKKASIKLLVNFIIVKFFACGF